MVETLIALLGPLLISSTLTFSPFSTTYHFIDAPVNTPNHWGVDEYTYHPQFSVLYTTEHMQYGGFFLLDTYAKPAGGFVLGPKLDLYKDYVSVGIVGGIYLRDNLSYNKFPISLKTGSLQVIPLVLGTLNLAVPISKRIDLTLNTQLAPNLVHQEFGFRIHFQ